MLYYTYSTSTSKKLLKTIFQLQNLIKRQNFNIQFFSMSKFLHLFNIETALKNKCQNILTYFNTFSIEKLQFFN